MTLDISRYSIDNNGEGWYNHNGDWVLFEEANEQYQQLAEEVDRLTALLELIARDVTSWDFLRKF